MDEFRIIRNWMAHNGGKARHDTGTVGNWARAQHFLRRNRGMIKFLRHNEIVVEDALVDRAMKRSAHAVARGQKAAMILYP